MFAKITVHNRTPDITDEQAFSFLVRVRMLRHRLDVVDGTYNIYRSVNQDPRWYVRCTVCGDLLYFPSRPNGGPGIPSEGCQGG